MIRSEKTYKLIASLVGYDVTVTLISSPEILITGLLSSFDFQNEPAIITIQNTVSVHVINWADVSQIIHKQNNTGD